jgi:hypothetical protein
MPQAPGFLIPQSSAKSNTCPNTGENLEGAKVHQTMDGAWSVKDATIYKSIDPCDCGWVGPRAIAEPSCQWMKSCVTLFSMDENFYFKNLVSNDACTERTRGYAW